MQESFISDNTLNKNYVFAFAFIITVSIVVNGSAQQYAKALTTKTYENPLLGLKVPYPSNWLVNDTKEGEVTFAPKLGHYPSITIMTLPRSTLNIDLKMHVDNLKQLVVSRGASIVDQVHEIRNGTDVYFFSDTANSPRGTVKNLFISTETNSTRYFFQLVGATSEEFNSLAAIFNYMFLGAEFTTNSTPPGINSGFPPATGSSSGSIIPDNGTGFSIYKNPNYRIEVTFPSNWTAKAPGTFHYLSEIFGNANHLEEFYPAPPEQTANFRGILVLFFVPTDISSITSYGSQLYDVIKNKQNIQILRAGFINIGSFAGARLAYSAYMTSDSSPGMSVPAVFDLYWMKYADKGYLNFAFIATSDGIKFLPAAKQIINSIKLTSSSNTTGANTNNGPNTPAVNPGGSSNINNPRCGNNPCVAMDRGP
jgi:hypothetical protein